MKENILLKIEQLINEKKIDEAQLELSRLGQNYNNNANYLYLRGKVFYINKLYYAAIDALLIAFVIFFILTSSGFFTPIT